jgi:hypothetical protein
MGPDNVREESLDLYRLIYYSRNRVAGAAELSAEVASILSTARQRNQSLDVTGALIFNNGVFAQVLEGPRQNIEAIFERIQRDARHGDIHVLAFEKVSQRSFPEWSMAFIGHSREGQELFSHIGVITGFDAKRLEGERVLTLIQAIAIEEENIHSAAHDPLAVNQ